MALICGLVTNLYLKATKQGATVHLLPPGIEFQGYEVVGELRTDGIEIYLDFSHGGGQFDLTKSIQAIDKPSIDFDHDQLKVGYRGKVYPFPKSYGRAWDYQWLATRKILVFNASKGEEESIWRWDQINGYRQISTPDHAGFGFHSVSLDGKYFVSHIMNDPHKPRLLVCALDGIDEFEVDIPERYEFEVVMLNRDEFLIPVHVFNDAKYVKKWYRKENRFESLPMKGRLSSAVVYNGAIWGHRHEGNSSPFAESAETANEIVRLNPDLKTIEQTVPLPKGLEHFESRR